MAAIPLDVNFKAKVFSGPALKGLEFGSGQTIQKHGEIFSLVIHLVNRKIAQAVISLRGGAQGSNIVYLPEVSAQIVFDIWQDRTETR